MTSSDDEKNNDSETPIPETIPEKKKRGPKPYPKDALAPFKPRRKGIPNKRSWDVVRALERLGYDPAAKLVQLALDAEADYRENRFNESGPQYLAIAVRATTEMMKFVYPTRKAVDITSGDKPLGETLSALIAQAITDKTSG